MADNVQKEIVSIVSDVTGFEPDEITPESNFYDDLEVDSVKAIEIAVAIEKRFKVTVRDEEIPNITTVKQAVDIVEKLLEEKEDNVQA
ncbi:MAG TPA: acyl carrier protein [Nitrospirae bacterium]|nr:acyl carrier protein [Nitrospirota bacterium]